ncbi:hypothetical protein DSO57_1006699 [Entomophthora muscae]|uniref:Uncharacterized protein n=1 Tax=Entomophthora muscae TaxID=34485 RepID=A0ACC2UH84_9FUNG|nr:hypothetical protein DSO57_1006699 [Entomophthora muscae]
METLDKKENLKAINWDSCQIKIIHFKDHKDTTTPQDCEIVTCHQEIFKEALPGSLTEKHIQCSIQLKGAVPKAQPIYCLTPNKDNNVVNATIHHVLNLPLVGHFEEEPLAFAFASQNELMTKSGNTIVWFLDSVQLTCPLMLVASDPTVLVLFYDIANHYILRFLFTNKN